MFRLIKKNRESYKIMFRLIKKLFIALLNFSGSLANIVNVSDHTKYISLINN